MNLNLFYQSSKYYKSDDGLILHYRDLGPQQGKPVVLCLPGLTRNSRDFEQLATILSNQFRVLCPDLRGRGLSDYDPHWQNYHPLTYCNDIWKLLDDLSIQKIIIIGTSLGGIIAMNLAKQQAKRVTKVVLNDIGPEIDPIGLTRISKYTGRLEEVDNWKQACEQTQSIYGYSLPNLPSNQWMVLAKRAYKENSDHKPILDMDAQIGQAIREVGPQKGDPWLIFDALKNIPSLVLRGELSDILSQTTVDKMLKRNPLLLSATISNRGHVPLLDETECLSAIGNLLGVCLI